MIPTFLPIAVMIALLLTGCGPSEQEIATMTASAWTATPPPTTTPTPTPTATPIPYDLTVKVTDAEGNPVPAASLMLAGEDAPGLADETGEAAWVVLVEPEGSLEVTAQGYLDASQDFSLSRGPNELTIALERDPYGLLPSQACAPGETLVYLEDFQDGDAANLPEVQFAANGWSLQEFSAEPGNFVIVNEMPEMHPHAVLEEIQLDQTVMRFDYYKSANTDMAFNFISKGEFEDEEGTMVQDSRYMVITYDQEGGRVELRRHYQPISELSVRRARFRIAPEEWHHIEISRYEGRLELWVDNALVASYDDPRPLTPGGFNFEIFESTSPDARPAFDNITICNLSASFMPMPTATPSPE